MARFRDERERQKQADDEAARRARNGGFIHTEAFCLMKYADEFGNVEVIWNSRDGVTPMFLHSVAGREMRHVDWRWDRRVEHHVPNVGDRIFIDLTIEKAREYRRAFVERYWDDGEYPMRERTDVWQTKEEAVERLARGDMEHGGGGTPDIVVVDERLRDELQKRALAAVQKVVDGGVPS